MRPTRLVAPFLALGLLLACSGYSVNYDYDVTANYARYKTFDYYTSKKGTGGTTSLMDKRVRAAVEKELQARGFTLQTQGDPDFLVTYYPIVKERRTRTTTHVSWGWGFRPVYGRIGTSSSQIHTHQEGTIVIEIVDFRTNQMVWQGAAAGALTGLDNPEDADEVVPRAVRDILAKFPPK